MNYRLCRRSILSSRILLVQSGAHLDPSRWTEGRVHYFAHCPLTVTHRDRSPHCFQVHTRRAPKFRVGSFHGRALEYDSEPTMGDEVFGCLLPANHGDSEERQARPRSECGFSWMILDR